MIIFLILIIILSFYAYKKEIKIKKILLFSFLCFVSLFTFKTLELLDSKTIKITKKDYLLRLTHYYTGDATGSGKYLPGTGNYIPNLVSSGKLRIEASTDWYLYNDGGIDYLVLATATVQCLNVNSSKDGCYKYRLAGPTNGIKYRSYKDKMVLLINGKKYNGMVLDSCGECMKPQYANNEKIDVLVKGKNPKVVPDATTVTILSEDPSAAYNASDYSPITYGNNTSNYSTSYTGDLKKGWLFLRFNEKVLTKRTDADTIEDTIDGAINEIYRRAGSNENSSSSPVKTGMEGKPIYGKTIKSPIPDYVKSAMQSPVGTQTCNQSSCFGYYSSGNCSSHGGVDLTSTPAALIYSAAEGVVTNVIYNSTQCSPKFTSTGASCGPGCTGNIVTIKHTFNGEEWYTKYVHMSSINSAIKLDATVSKGQEIGIIGTTGCSTGVHLHFEIIGPGNSLYNPEEILTTTCKLRSDCNLARSSCSK